MRTTPDQTTLREFMDAMEAAPESLARLQRSPALSRDHFGTEIAVLEGLDRLPIAEQRLTAIEPEGCCKGGEHDEADVAFAARHAGQRLAEKVRLAR